MDKEDKAANSSSLESAIRDRAEDAISEIARKEAAQIKKLNDAYAAELDDFRKEMKARTDARIAQESSRVQNRASLELRKLKLKHVEEFITRTVEEVVNGIRDNTRYKSFLLDAVSDAVRRIPTGAEVRLKVGDLIFETELREAIAKAGGKDVAIIQDETIKWGGCIIVDVTGGRVFDSTIERVCYRKAPVIRREVMALLGHSPGRQ